jgi:hypothetical protein
MDMTRFKVVIAFVYLLALIPASVYAQGDGTGLNASFHISEVRIVFMEDTIAQSSKDLIRSSVLNKLKVFPHDYVRRGDLDRAMLSVGTIPEISSVTYDLELSHGQSFILCVRVSTQGERVLMEGNTGIFSKNPKGSFPYLFRSKNFIAKLDIGVGATVAVGGNPWFGNGEFFTQFSPFGKDYPEGTFASFEGAFMPGITMVLKVSKNSYLYGNYKALFVSTLGRDLYRSDNPADIATENLYFGLVGTIPTAKGNVINYNLSAGRQPYRIGTGMLLCQIATNGGDRAGLNLWPRFSGDFVGLAQVRYDNLKAEYFYVDPSEFGGFESETRLTGFNLEYSKPYGAQIGFTYLHALRSNSLVLFPDGSQESREGLSAYNLRAEWKGRPGTNSIIANVEGGLQTNSRFPVRAWGMAAELGYTFSEKKLSPSFSYRFSHLTGDDPETERYERWDLLYSGNDVNTWVQGLLMKNILYNTNLQAHRIQGQMISKGWRFTGQYFFFRSDQLNNLPLAINTFASRNLAQQITVMAEKSFLKRFYTRIVFNALWALDGINDSLPNDNAGTWTGFQAMIRYQL